MKSDKLSEHGNQLRPAGENSLRRQFKKMDRAIPLRLLATLMLLMLYSNAESQWVGHHPLPPVSLPPLCSSQFALANRACSILPYAHASTPASPTESHHHHHHHGHHHHSHGHGSGHSHGHMRHRHEETRAEEDCCRWVKEIDNVCVCVLLAHLSPFLTRPAHNYTLIVDESCQVNFACPSFIPI